MHLVDLFCIIILKRTVKAAENTLYVLLCCYINWVNSENLAELVPLAELAYLNGNCKD
jgi:hypothetical protein